jgi:hypothetical protein
MLHIAGKIVYFMPLSNRNNFISHIETHFFVSSYLNFSRMLKWVEIITAGLREPCDTFF